MSGFGRKTVLITFGRSYLSLHLARLMGAAGHDVLITTNVSQVGSQAPASGAIADPAEHPC